MLSITELMAILPLVGEKKPPDPECGNRAAGGMVATRRPTRTARREGGSARGATGAPSRGLRRAGSPAPASPGERGAGVVRVLGHPLQHLAERLLDRALGVAQGPGELPHQHVGDDHRRQLPPGQDVTADRELVVGQVLVDPIVEPLVAPAEQCHVRLGDQLVGDRVVKQWPRRREQHHPRLLGLAVGGLQRRVDDVDPQHHPRPTPIGRVVDLPRRQRRRVPIVEQPQLVPRGDRVRHRPLRPKPIERLGKQGEDVQLHRAPSLNASAFDRFQMSKFMSSSRAGVPVGVKRLVLFRRRDPRTAQGDPRKS